MDKFSICCIFVYATRLPVGKTASYGNNQICCGNSIVRGLFPVHSRKTEKLRMGAWYSSDSHKCSGNRKMEFLHKCRKLLLSSCRNDSTACDYKRTLSLKHYLLCLSRVYKKIRVRTCFFLFFFLERRIFHIRKENISRNIYKYRPRAALFCQLKGLTNGFHKKLRIFDLVIMLCNRHSHADNIRFLKRVASKKSCIDLSCYCYHRDRIHKRCSDSGNEVCGTGA